MMNQLMSFKKFAFEVNSVTTIIINAEAPPATGYMTLWDAPLHLFISKSQLSSTSRDF